MGVVLLIGCGPSSAEPVLVPGALPSIGRAPEPVVVCPAGSEWDAARQVCLAVQEVPEPPPVEPPKPAVVAQETAATGTVRVTCAFANGWVSVMPANKYPRDDQYLMQALIGLTDEPAFWTKESEYLPFVPYKAKKCGAAGVSFEIKKGSYFLLAGEAGTFSKRGEYIKNGYKKKMDLDPDAPRTIDLKSADLTHTWFCISCPWVAFFDPGGGAGELREGAYLPSFVVLKDRRSKGERGTDRVAVASVPVKDGKVKLRVVEAEHEVTHLDRLALEIEGKTVTPSLGGAAASPGVQSVTPSLGDGATKGGMRGVRAGESVLGRSALGDDDGVEVEMARGKMIEVTYDVPGVADGVYSGAVVATGYYVPTLD